MPDLMSLFQRKKTIPMQDGMQGRQQTIAEELLPACRNSQTVPSLQGWPKGGPMVAQGWREVINATLERRLPKICRS